MKDQQSYIPAFAAYLTIPSSSEQHQRKLDNSIPYIEIQSNLWRKKHHRTKFHSSNFRRGSFRNRDNVRVPIQFRRESQPQPGPFQKIKAAFDIGQKGHLFFLAAGRGCGCGLRCKKFHHSLSIPYLSVLQCKIKCFAQKKGSAFDFQKHKRSRLGPYSILKDDFSSIPELFIFTSIALAPVLLDRSKETS